MGSRDDDVPALLAWEMNGEPLTEEHGAPLRAVIPGVIGARSVKWVTKIALRDHEVRLLLLAIVRVLTLKICDRANASTRRKTVRVAFSLSIMSAECRGLRLLREQTKSFHQKRLLQPRTST